jgi:hypothetical protein
MLFFLGQKERVGLSFPGVETNPGRRVKTQD